MKCGFCGKVPARWACRNKYSNKWQPACGKCAAWRVARGFFSEVVDSFAIWPKERVCG